MPDNNEFAPDLFTLEDEEGKEQTFELLDSYEEGDHTYFALIPQQTGNDEEDSENDYFVILKRDENDPFEYLDSIDDEAELDRLAEIFLSRIMAHHDDECGCDGDDCDCHHND